MSKLKKLSLMLMCQICSMPLHATDNTIKFLSYNDLEDLGYLGDFCYITPFTLPADSDLPFPIYKNEKERKQSQKIHYNESPSGLPSYSLPKQPKTSPDSNNRQANITSNMTNQHTPPEFLPMPSGILNSFGSLFLEDYDVRLIEEGEILPSVSESYYNLQNLKSDAENGHPESQYTLGVRYLEKSKEQTEFSQSYCDRGIEFLQKAAKKDHINSIILIANYYYQKYKTSNNIEHFNESKKYCLQGIKLKAPIALRGLATLYLTSQDHHKQAISLYEKSIKLGDPHAALDLGLIYQQGKIVNKNFKTALEYFEIAADADIIRAKFHLGVLLINMGNKREGQKLLDELEKSEDKHALCMLGELYTGNQYQNFKDLSKATFFLKRSSKLGSQNSNYNLGKIYQELGDHEEAQAWFSKTGERLPKGPTFAQASDRSKQKDKQKSKAHKPITTSPLEKNEIEAVSKKRERTQTPSCEAGTQPKLPKLIIKTNPRSRSADSSMDTDVTASLNSTPPTNLPTTNWDFVSVKQKQEYESQNSTSESLSKYFDSDIVTTGIKKAFGQNYNWYTPKKVTINKNWFNIQIAMAPNDANAAYELAQGYENGTSGLGQSTVLALKYYETAANLGNAKARYQLGLMTKELAPVKAFHLIKSSADQYNSSALYALGVLYLKGIGTKVNHYEAFKTFVSAANYGHDEAPTVLYWMFMNEIGLPKDKIKAYLSEHANATLLSHPQMTNIIAEIVFKHLKIKSSIGDSNANYKLGHMYCKKGEFKEAIKLFELSANKQNHSAHFALGNLYMQGQGTEINLNSAFKHFMISANLGNSLALDEVRSMYLNERCLEQRAYFKEYLNEYGHAIMLSEQIVAFITNQNDEVNPLKKTTLSNRTNKNFPKTDWLKPHSTQWNQDILNQYRTDVQNGSSEAQVKLARAYQKGQLGMDIAPQEAITLYEKAAAQDNIDAIWGLAEIYHASNLAPKDVNKYLECLERGAKLGDKEAQYVLGERYRTGIDVAKDLVKSSDFFLAAAQKGQSHAQFKLALLYMDGQMEGGATELNMYKGIEWLEKSAEAGYIKAKHELGLLYFAGKHTNKDFHKAHELVLSTARMGYAPSQYYLARLYLTDSSKKHINEGCLFLHTAAKGKLPEAEYYLGLCLISGQYFPQDINQGLDYLKMASDKDYTDAQYQYGHILLDGKYNDKLICEAAPEMGIKLIQEAIKKGHKLDKPSQEKMDRALRTFVTPTLNNESVTQSKSKNTPKAEPSNSGEAYSEWIYSNQPKNQFVHTLDKEKKLEEIINPTLSSTHNSESLTRKDIKTYLPSQGIVTSSKPANSATTTNTHNNRQEGHHSYPPQTMNYPRYNDIYYGYNNGNYFTPQNYKFNNYMGHLEAMNIPEHLKPSFALASAQGATPSQRIVFEEKITSSNKPESK